MIFYISITRSLPFMFEICSSHFTNILDRKETHKHVKNEQTREHMKSIKQKITFKPI